MIKRKLKEVANMLKGEIVEDKYEYIEIEGVSIDTRTINENQLFVPVVGENNDGHKYIEMASDKGASAALWDKKNPIPETDIPLILVEDTTKGLQNLAKEYNKQIGARVIGVTGSNGKTSTKDIIESILKSKYKTHKTHGNLNNEYGLPLTVLFADDDTEMLVLEIGMSGLGDIRMLCDIAPPDIAVITNSTDVHINDLGSVENILKAKMEIAEGLKECGLLVYLGDSFPLKKAVENLDRNIKKISFGEESHNNYVTQFESAENMGINFKVGDNKYFLPMLGRYNIFNAGAAVGVVEYLGFRPDEIQEAILEVNATGLRNELIKGENFHILNDAYKSNPISLRFALQTLYDLEGYSQKIIVLGDMFGTGDNEVENHITIGEEIDPNQVDMIFTLGELGEYFAKGAQKNFGKDKIHSYKNLDDLAENLKPNIMKDSIILIKGSRILEMERILDKIL